uniref:lysocardiolipin acyltransferase 1-like n=1 Tax=Styela clava TaxID=7725 RepID=UPI0019392BEE|nr:lysocardiolipin acyltransferase 1-like [Styela clava]
MAETHTGKNVPLGSFMSAIIGLVFGLTSLFGSIFLHGPMIPLMFLWPWLYRRLTEIAASMWQALLVATLEKIFRVKLVITGDTIRRHEKTLLIMNHRTRLDWMFFFCCVFHCRVLNRHKITLKSILKWIPGAGWGMQTCGYIFLERNWETDKKYITNMLNHFVALKAYPNYLFFPEGTDLTEFTKARSNKFATQHNLKQYEYVLHPRTTGFIHMISTLREVCEIQAVHDVTVAYPKTLSQGESDLISGNVPEEVHFHIKRHDIEELPKDEEGLSEWCKQRWREKEEMLRAYYNDECDTGQIQTITANRRFPNDKVPPLSERGLLMWFTIVGWLVFLIASITFIIVSPIARWFSCVMILFYVLQGRLFGGMEKLEMFVYEVLQEWKNSGQKPTKPSLHSNTKHVKKQ